MDAKTSQLLQAAISKRAALFKRTNAVRLCNGLGDKLPGLVLEQYRHHFVCHLFDKAWLPRKDMLTAFIQERLGPQYLIFKERFDAAALSNEKINASVALQGASSKAIVIENGLKFEVDLHDGLNSGLFLDMRANRAKVAALAKGRKVLNCFAYTCSFGVACRASGAASVVNVDISKKALGRGEANYKLNALEAGKDEFVRAEAHFYLDRAAKKDNRFDLIILDPPSFARYEGKSFSVKKDMPALIAAALKVLNANGILFVSTNFNGLSSKDLEKMVRALGRKITSLEHLGQDVDFPGSGKMAESYLAALLVKVNG